MMPYWLAGSTAGGSERNKVRARLRPRRTKAPCGIAVFAGAGHPCRRAEEPTGRLWHLASQCGCASQQIQVANVRFGSKADIGALLIDVRFTPKSGHRLSMSTCPL